MADSNPYQTPETTLGKLEPGVAATPGSHFGIYKSPKGLGTGVTICLIITIVTSLIGAWDAFQFRQGFALLEEGNPSAEAITDFVVDYENSILNQIISGIGGLNGIAVIVLWCMWTHCIARNAWTTGLNNLTVSPGWAVGWHFIPVACWWMPVRAMLQAWAATASVKGEHQSRGIVALWWTFWLGYQFLSVILMVVIMVPMFTQLANMGTNGDMSEAAAIEAVFSGKLFSATAFLQLAYLATTVVALIFVRRFTGFQITAFEGGSRSDTIPGHG